MDVSSTTDGPLETSADTIVVAVFEGEGVAHDLPGGALGALLEAGEARTSWLHLAVTHAEGRRFVLIGLGARGEFDGERARLAAAAAGDRARELGAERVCWEVPHHVDESVVRGLVEGTVLGAYRFDRYKTSSEDSARAVSELILSAHHDISGPVGFAAIATRAQNRARDLANTPANDMTPSALAEYASALEGVSVSVLDGEQIRSAGMGAFAAVAQGSRQDARLIRLEYRGAPDGGPLLGLVGKAVTFDSGGLSIKPSASMAEMKFDMCGGAAVIEAIAALAELRAPVNVLGVVGSTENMPDGGAVKPGDIVRALDGTTIEINNTDAEGRLVLADCLCYARREGCERLIDICTLTGGVVVALGSWHAGLMANDDAFADTMAACGVRTGERVWRLPLAREYADMVKGRYADITNLTERREASSITGGEFLHRFVGEVPWAHLDIAGTAYDVPRSYLGKSATGFGVRLLVEAAQALAA